MLSLLSEEDACCLWTQLYRNTLTTDLTQAFQNYHNIFMLWTRSVRWLVKFSSHDFRYAWRNLFGKCVCIVVYAQFFLLDKKKYPTQICTSCHFHQAFFYAIFQNAHKSRWMETQLVTALKYETNMFQKFRTCLSDNSYISYMGLCTVYALFF